MQKIAHTGKKLRMQGNNREFYFDRNMATLSCVKSLLVCYVEKCEFMKTIILYLLFPPVKIMKIHSGVATFG